ncbi:MAG: SAM hydroxide adenosyltransferase, partial [Myxococcota bacterium]
ITRDHLNGAHRLRLTCNAHNASAEGLYTSYEEAPLETPVLLIGSSGYLEVAVRRGSAERLLGWGPSTPCAVEILDA